MTSYKLVLGNTFLLDSQSASHPCYLLIIKAAEHLPQPDITDYDYRYAEYEYDHNITHKQTADRLSSLFEYSVSLAMLPEKQTVNPHPHAWIHEPEKSHHRGAYRQT